ncbi:ModE family transcriptional regulator [Algivirga pacifica]|uniref:Winged helix-turn-helix domain-containing protein n=1 Tax=Algivirga pacifica TaxID=1162670 RepID=A0ABP9D8T3_9BACT
MKEIKGRFWIEDEGIPLLGEGKIVLLETLLKENSISSAAKAVGISYRKAWRLLEEMNKLSEEAVIEKSTGGKNGGGTKVTAKGMQYIHEYRSFQKQFRSFLKAESKELQKRIEAAPSEAVQQEIKAIYEE